MVTDINDQIIATFTYLIIGLLKQKSLQQIAFEK